MTSPAEELRAAATKLRKLVADLPASVSTPPWRPIVTDTESLSGVGICEAHEGVGEHDACDNCRTVETWQEDLAAYMASMHPGVALALATAMDQVAWVIEFDEHMIGRVGYPELVETARVVLGREEPR